MGTIRTTIFVAAVLLLTTSAVFAQGTLLQDFYWSDLMQDIRLVNVYLPEGYDSGDAALRYPVLYYLHGGGGDEFSDEALLTSLDDGIASGTLEPMIIVKPNACCTEYGGMSWYSDSEVLGPFESYITGELIDFIDGRYNTDPVREKRALMGFSMGGYGAAALGLKHPELYCAIVSHTGILSLPAFLDELVPYVLEENDGSGPFYPQRGPFSRVLFAAAAAWSPDPDASPDPVLLPIDNEGERVESVMNTWQVFDPAVLVSTVSAVERPAMYIDCGTEDLWYPVTEAFCDTISTHGISCVMESYEGNHTSLPARFPISLAFVNQQFQVQSDVAEDESNRPDRFRLDPCSPNPFNASTVVTLTLPSAGTLDVRAFNLLGREVARLAHGRSASGEVRLPFHAAGLASGTYVIRARLEGFGVRSQRVVLLR